MVSFEKTLNNLVNTRDQESRNKTTNKQIKIFFDDILQLHKLPYGNLDPVKSSPTLSKSNKF